MPTLNELMMTGGKTPLEYMQDSEARAAEAQTKQINLRDLMMKQKQTEQGYADDAAHRADTAKYPDPNELLKATRAGGRHKQADIMETNLMAKRKAESDLANQEATRKKTQVETSIKNFEMAGAVFGAASQDPNATHEKALAAIQKSMNNGFLTREQAEEAYKDLQTTPNAGQWLKSSAMEAMQMKDQLQAGYQKATQEESGRHNRATETNAAGTLEQTRRNQEEMRKLQAGQLAVSQGNLALAKNRDARDAAANTPEALAAASMPKRKPRTEAQEGTYRKQMGKDFAAANTILDNMEEVATSAESVKTAPGLKGATGIQSYFPSYPNSKAATAEVRLSNLEGKITNLGKAAASSAGAIGQMAVQEWKIVRDMIAAIDRSKGDEPLLEQIGLVEAQAAGAAERLRLAYETQYANDFETYPQFKNIGTTKERKGANTTKPAAPKANGGWAIEKVK
jgi:hypothetical protein